MNLWLEQETRTVLMSSGLALAFTWKRTMWTTLMAVCVSNVEISGIKEMVDLRGKGGVR